MNVSRLMLQMSTETRELRVKRTLLLSDLNLNRKMTPNLSETRQPLKQVTKSSPPLRTTHGTWARSAKEG
jgi:hypothetical protein